MSNQNQNQDPIVLQAKVKMYEIERAKQTAKIDELQKQNYDLTSAVSILKKERVPPFNLSMIKGDTDDLESTCLRKHRGFLRDDCVSAATPFAKQILEMLETPPPTDLLLTMLYDIHSFMAVRTPMMIPFYQKEALIGYSEDKGKFVLNSEEIWSIKKVRVQVREGYHDDAIRDWLEQYISDENSLPDGLSLTF